MHEQTIIRKKKTRRMIISDVQLWNYTKTIIRLRLSE